MSIETIHAIFDAAPGPVGGLFLEVRIQGERVETPPPEVDGRIPIGGFFLVLDDDGRFVEMEDELGSSVSVGGWHEATENRWALVWEHDTRVAHTMPDAMGYSVPLHVAGVLCNALLSAGVVHDSDWTDAYTTALDFYGDLALHIMALVTGSIDDRMEASDVAMRLGQCIRGQLLLWGIEPSDDLVIERVAARAARAHVRITERKLFHVRAQRDEEADRQLAQLDRDRESMGVPPVPTDPAMDLESANRVSAQQVADADRVNELHSRRFDRT